MTESRKGHPGAIPASLAASPQSDMRLSLALRQISFVPGAAGAPAQQPAFDAAAALNREAGARRLVERTLARREWLLDVAERQRALSPHAGGVPRIRQLSGDAFLDHFYAPGRPVVIQGAMEEWPALERWTPQYLRDQVGSAEVEYQGARTANADFELYKDKHKQRIGFDRFIDMVTAEGAGNDAYITAYNSGTNQAALAPLHADLDYLEDYLTREHGMMWVGPAGTFTPLHFDLTNNLLAQVVGVKRVILVPPSETRLMAHSRHVFSGRA